MIAGAHDLPDLGGVGGCCDASAMIDSPPQIEAAPLPAREPLSARMAPQARRSSTDLTEGFLRGLAAVDDLLSGEPGTGGDKPRLLGLPSLLDGSHDTRMPDIGKEDPQGAADDATCAETDSSRASPVDALAAEVGASAHEYLEECFYAEVAVLDRRKFEAVPEIDKGDFIVTGHLGKGSFSDVFEVVSKAKQPTSRSRGPSRRASDLGSPPAMSKSNAADGRRKPHPFRTPRRASLTLYTNNSHEDRPKFALKCLRPQIRSDVEQFLVGAEDLVHETAMLANLDHRHIIKIHGRAAGCVSDAFRLNDGYFVLLDRLNETLRDRIERWHLSPKCMYQGPTLPQLEVARDVAEAVAYLHSNKIIFRDLKPANVGFDSDGVLKLFDFGFASGLPKKDRENPSGLLFDRCGTPRYMAAEVGLCTGYSLPADVYSFGILLWEICSLSKPFAGINSSSKFERAVFVDGARPVVNPKWPSAVGDLMRRCWAGPPGMRPGMEEVKAMLSAAMKAMEGGERSAPRRGNVRQLPQ